MKEKRQWLLPTALIVGSVLIAGGWYLLWAVNMARDFGRIFEPYAPDIARYLNILLHASFVQFAFAGAGLIFGIVIFIKKLSKQIFISLLVIFGAYVTIAFTNMIALIAFARGETTMFYLVQVMAIVLAGTLILLLTTIACKKYRQVKL